MERKNPLGLIRAFKRAFRAEEPARLVLKTTFGIPFRDNSLRCANCEGARITIIDEIFTRGFLALIECCDVYVSLHRSEGLGLTMAEAMLWENPWSPQAIRATPTSWLPIIASLSITACEARSVDSAL